MKTPRENWTPPSSSCQQGEAGTLEAEATQEVGVSSALTERILGITEFAAVPHPWGPV